MKPYLSPAVLAAFALVACSGEPATQQDETSAAATPVPTKTSSGALEITWEDLLPEGEEEEQRLAELYAARAEQAAGLAEGGAGDIATQFGSYTTVSDFEGMKIRLPGYTVPFDYGYEAEISEFLLVPYFGACLHAPPPPPNQTIYVTTSKPIRLVDLAQAVWVEGTLRATRQETELADAAYTIELAVTEDYYGQN